MRPGRVSAIVVSFNRKPLLKLCLDSLQAQGELLDSIFVIDNASTDGSAEWLAGLPAESYNRIKPRLLKENLGGAGGFAEGLALACREGAEWIWMMDDDACPHPDALRELMFQALDAMSIYGSLAVFGDQASWSLELLPSKRRVGLACDFPSIAEVVSLPFLGFLIHRDLVAEIGLPDAGYFIAADDLEYCLRARKQGSKIFVVSGSKIEHPMPQRKTVRLASIRFNFVHLAPWKRYYDIRNRIFIARKYFGVALYCKTLPSIFVRFLASMIFEQAKLRQCKAYIGGVFDGLAGKDGARHSDWGLS